MNVLKCKDPTSGEALYIVMDSYASKADAVTALEAFIDTDEVEQI